jgi:phytoene/squalene synthetase
VFVALADTIATFDLPITPFSSLLAGFRTDLETSRYATFADLRGYTASAAEPVGRLFLYTSGYREPALLGYADDLSSGLALAHFWQDLAADLARERLYVPEEDLRHFQLDPADLRAPGAHERPPVAARLGALLRYEVVRTRSLFERARPLIDEVGDDLAVELAISWHGGMRILDKIYDAGASVLSHRPQLTNYDKAQVVSRAVAWRGGSLARRAGRRLGKLPRPGGL